MTTHTKSFFRTQLLEMDRLADSAKDDPLLSFAIESRRKSLEEEMAQASPEPAKPRTVLFFAGPPVMGSRGIDAKFATDVLGPFLEMVKTQYSAQKHGRVGARGPRRGENEARLLLTGLPRGSFGLELSQPQAEDFIAAEQLSDTLVRLTEVIAAAADTDERFSVSLDHVSPRVLPRLKDFLAVVASNNAYLGVESGELKVELPVNRLEAALERVGSAKTTDRVVTLDGTFRGATLDSWRFDFRADGEPHEVISGRIADEVDDDAVTAMIQLTTKSCQAKLREITVTTSDGASRKRYELLALEERV
jgi:hypothetical protein